MGSTKHQNAKGGAHTQAQQSAYETRHSPGCRGGFGKLSSKEKLE